MTLLEVQDLTVAYATREGSAIALDGLSVTVGAGERVGIIGESGSGKTTLAMSLGRLLPSSAHVVGGDITVGGRSVTALRGDDLRRFRSNEIGYIFQDPAASLDPTKRISKQLMLAGAPKDADLHAMLAAAQLSDPERVLRSFPHELSGGMAQRVVIVMALMRSPRLIVADEPTAALDAIVRKHILELLVDRATSSSAGLLLFTHDLGAVRSFCDRVIVMYGGRVVEDGPRRSVLEHPLHPYTQALLHALPGDERRDERLAPIAGSPPVIPRPGGACAFAPRCAFATPECVAIRPSERALDDRLVACHHAPVIRHQETSNVG